MGKHNRSSLGICLVGDFRKYDPPDVQYNAAVELLKDVAKAYNITNENIKGHSEFSGYKWKKCPALDMDKLRSDISDRKS